MRSVFALCRNQCFTDVSRVLFCETALIFIGYGFKRVLRDCELTQPHAITQAAAEATLKVHSA